MLLVLTETFALSAGATQSSALGGDQLARGRDTRLGDVFGELDVRAQQAGGGVDLNLLAKLVLELGKLRDVLLNAVEICGCDLTTDLGEAVTGLACALGGGVEIGDEAAALG